MYNAFALAQYTVVALQGPESHFHLCIFRSMTEVEVLDACEIALDLRGFAGNTQASMYAAHIATTSAHGHAFHASIGATALDVGHVSRRLEHRVTSGEMGSSDTTRRQGNRPTSYAELGIRVDIIASPRRGSIIAYRPRLLAFWIGEFTRHAPVALAGMSHIPHFLSFLRQRMAAQDETPALRTGERFSLSDFILLTHSDPGHVRAILRDSSHPLYAAEIEYGIHCAAPDTRSQKHNEARGGLSFFQSGSAPDGDGDDCDDCPLDGDLTRDDYP